MEVFGKSIKLSTTTFTLLENGNMYNKGNVGIGFHETGYASFLLFLSLLCMRGRSKLTYATLSDSTPYITSGIATIFAWVFPARLLPVLPPRPRLPQRVTTGYQLNAIQAWTLDPIKGSVSLIKRYFSWIYERITKALSGSVSSIHFVNRWSELMTLLSTRWFPW